MGSLRLRGRCKARGDRIVAMISLETIGYFSDAPRSQTYPVSPGLACFIRRLATSLAFVGNVPSRWLVRRAIAEFRQRREKFRQKAQLFLLLWPALVGPINGHFGNTVIPAS